MPDDIPSLRRILRQNRRIAVVGLSDNWYRPSYFAAKYMQTHGYQILPVNPKYAQVLGETCYPDLAAIDQPIDIVDVFQRPENTPAFARQAVAVGAKVLWLQLGIENREAEQIATAGGLEVVMNRCLKIEHARLFGGLNFVGVDTKIITATRNKIITN